MGASLLEVDVEGPAEDETEVVKKLEAASDAEDGPVEVNEDPTEDNK